MHPLAIERTISVRIPTAEAEFRLLHYTNSQDEKEHIALVTGDVSGQRDVLVRVHSECLTGDVFGSLRCDCGGQLLRSMQMVSLEGRGVILYLRQEGRGIGLLDKLRAYDLQDKGYDTVDANLLLGHEADERDYEVAALILKDIGVESVQLLTNNLAKIDDLRRFGIQVVSRRELRPQVNAENANYLMTKVERMGHLIDMASVPLLSASEAKGAQMLHRRAELVRRNTGRPFVTLTYAQSLDGSIARVPGQRMRLSGPEAQAMTHQLRATHHAILVGIGTVLADDPSLTVRLADGKDPQPVILDSKLLFPLDAKLLDNRSVPPWIVTSAHAPQANRTALEERGARIVEMPTGTDGLIDLDALMAHLAAQGIDSLMVEGGSRVITNFLAERLVDHIVLTVAPVLVGGMRAAGELEPFWGVRCPRLMNSGNQRFGDDLVIWGDVDWGED